MGLLPTPANREPTKDELIKASLAEISQALEHLTFGHILITVHGGKVVQMEVTEKKRFT